MQTRRFFLNLIILVLVLWVTSCSVSEVPTIESTSPTETPTTSKETTAKSNHPIATIEVRYFTPPQQEGPYYPLDKPADRDNDLVDFAGAAAQPAGEVLFLSGIVYDAGGRPVQGAVVEIWQTDSEGAYLHPDDPRTDQRDTNFQFYGESVTGADGVYSFRTILPGLYGSRPRHIHLKVRFEEKVVLTTQFYFANEVRSNGVEENLLIDMAPAEDDNGDPIWVGERDIILKIDL